MVIGKNRAIPPSLFTVDRLIELDSDVKVTAIGLRMHADDFGREILNLKRIRAALWFHRDEMTLDLLEDHMLELAEAGYITIYSIDGITYYAVRDWPVVSHPSPRVSSYPPPPEPFSSAASDKLAARSAEEREGERGERAGASEESPAGIPPSPFCKAHPGGTNARCRNCGTARLAHQQWLYERAAPEHPDPDATAETDWTA